MAGGTPSSKRLVSLDWMRGLVMVLMAIDHSSEAFNRGRLMTDGVMMFTPGTPLPMAQFLTRWITHLCAPTFVFLAGTAMALSIGRRTEAGESAGSIDRYLLVRGLVIAGFELVPSMFWMPKGMYLFQVLYAIGTSFLFMIPLRRLPTGAVFALGAVLAFSSEAIVGLAGWVRPEATPLVANLLFVPGRFPHLIVAYPTLPWLAIMMLGWGFGGYLSNRPDPARIIRVLVVAGATLLALFAVVRGANGYGNMALLRESGALVQWLHVSKYPPSLSFMTLELGLMALLIALVMRVTRNVTWSPRDPIVVLGRTPMFFYLLHIPLLWLMGKISGLEHQLGLGAAYSFAAFAAALLYPLCIYYGAYRARNPNGIARYV